LSETTVGVLQKKIGTAHFLPLAHIGCQSVSVGNNTSIASN